MVRSMLGVLVIAGTLVGCASSPQGGGVQVVDRNQRDKVTSGQYIVRRGDT
ncbi:MAG TPA: peptigoglycan-binding protein LysM, partial [Pseudomonas sp.]|nr:peptigoglycan-binding protein LysM [Pseudomonas sp.]